MLSYKSATTDELILYYICLLVWEHFCSISLTCSIPILVRSLIDASKVNCDHQLYEVYFYTLTVTVKLLHFTHWYSLYMPGCLLTIYTQLKWPILWWVLLYKTSTVLYLINIIFISLRRVTVYQRTKKLGYHISPWIPLNIYIKNSTLVISDYLAADIMIYGVALPYKLM